MQIPKKSKIHSVNNFLKRTRKFLSSKVSLLKYLKIIA